MVKLGLVDNRLIVLKNNNISSSAMKPITNFTPPATASALSTHSGAVSVVSRKLDLNEQTQKTPQLPYHPSPGQKLDPDQKLHLAQQYFIQFQHICLNMFIVF